MPQENLRENAIRRRRDPISGVEVQNTDPVVEVVVGQHVPRALGVKDLGVDGVRPANRRIRGIPTAHVSSLMRVVVATEAMMADVGMEDTCMEEETGMV